MRAEPGYMVNELGTSEANRPEAEALCVEGHPASGDSPATRAGTVTKTCWWETGWFKEWERLAGAEK